MPGRSTRAWEISLTLPTILEDRAEQATAIFAQLRADKTTGTKLRDAAFDQIYPREIRDISKIHWTPVQVAVRAAELLTATSVTPGRPAHILDVGSGIGKFCLVGALSTTAEFTGIEQREYFATFANNLVARHALPRLTYRYGNMADLDWSSFTGIYLFNPFYENIAEPIRIDRFVSVSQDRYDRYVRTVRQKLEVMPIGTRVVTYHGFGGEYPPGYRRASTEAAGTGALELWIKEVETDMPGLKTAF